MADRPMKFALVLTMILGVALSDAFAQTAPAPSTAAQPKAPAQSPAPGSATDPAPKDPYEAYETGYWNQALQGFVDQQVRRPDDPAVSLNVGSAHYEMGNFPEAQRAFAAAASDGDPEIRFQGLYNLGNTAFRQGKLDEAVVFYQAALEVNPEDEDAKFNLEYTRDEIRRRHEESQKRQEEQNEQGEQEQDQEGQGEEGEEGQEDQESQDQGEDQQQGEEGENSDPQESSGDGEQEPGQEESEPEESSQGQDEESEEQPTAGEPDADDDGLPDEVEREGANPTDPRNPDTDQDGLPDGAEDLDRDGEVDPGETDPNQADTDGDGIPDGQDPENTPTGQSAAGESASPSGEQRPLTAEEAARLLDSLEEGRPVQERPGATRRTRPEKDW